MHFPSARASPPMYATHNSNLSLCRVGILLMHSAKKRKIWTERLPTTRMRSCHSCHHCAALERTMHAAVLLLPPLSLFFLSFLFLSFLFLLPFLGTACIYIIVSRRARGNRILCPSP